MVSRKIDLPALLALAANAFAQTMGARDHHRYAATNLGTGIERSVTSNSTGSYVIGSVQRTAQFLEIC